MTAAATVLVLGLLVVTSVGLVVAQRRALVEVVEGRVRTEAAGVAALTRSGQARSPLPASGGDDAFAQVVGSDGTVVAATANATGLAPLAAPEGGGPSWRTMRDLSIDEEAFLVLSVRAGGAGGDAIVHVGAALDDVDEATISLRRSLTVAVPLVTVVLAGLVWVVVGRTLHPVEAIRWEVGAIGGTDLHRRVPEPTTNDEVARLARTMNAMLDRVEEASARQQRFVADASHELRGPLTRIRSELEVDLAHPEGADPAHTQRSMLEEVEGLARLVEDLLLLARGDAGADVTRSGAVDLDDVVDAAVAGVVARAVAIDRSGVEPVQVRGDRRQLDRAVGNVVANAVRHARHGVTVAVTDRDGHAVLSVEDDGDGVAPERRELVYGVSALVQ